MKLFFLFILLCGWAFGQETVPDYDPMKEDSNVPQAHHESVPFQKAKTRSGQEWRAFWADAWNKGFLNPTQVKETVKMASSYGYNAIVVQARRRGDAIYFPSYPNTEPRMSGLAQDFDALQEIIREAHASRLEVHAWITTFLISTPTAPTSPEHVFHKHPEYLTENAAGEKNISEGYYLDPGNPDALEWNSRVVMDLVEHYDIDGLHFDYVRYPQQNSGYNPVAVRRYNQEYGLSGKPAYNDERFSAWRRRQITDWIRSMYSRITNVKPSMKVTAATFSSRSDAYGNRFQDWARWMNEGMIDANLPMNYTTTLTLFQSRVDDILSHSYGRHVYMGIGSYLLDSASSVSQFEYAREKGAPGLLFFSYANNNKGGDWAGAFQLFHRNVFSIPAVVPEMPWKNGRVHGHLHGRITNARDGSPLYNARVLIPALKHWTKTDGAGNFAMLNLVAGKYTMRCQSEGHVLQEKSIEIVGGNVFRQDMALEEGEATEFVMDTDDASFTEGWTIGVSAPDKYGVDYRFVLKGSGAQKAIFELPKLSGRYRIYAWHSQGTNRTQKACYEIRHANGDSRAYVDQQIQGGTWRPLGSYDFSASGSVTLSDQFETGSVVLVDAIKIEKEK